MILWKHDPAQIARKEVAQWFAQTPTSPVFLPGDGRVLPLKREEAVSIRTGAEEKAVAWMKALETRIWIAIITVVTVVVGVQSFTSGLDEPWKGGVKAAAFAIYSLHGVWILYEVFAHNRQVKTLRASIAHSLAGRIPLAEPLAGKLGLANPVRYVLIGLGAVLVGWNLLAEFISHWGIDLIGIIPPWLVLAIAVFIVIAALGNQWIDRQRGGAPVPEDAPRR